MIPRYLSKRYENTNLKRYFYRLFMGISSTWNNVIQIKIFINIDWIKKLWFICSIKYYYSIVKKTDEILACGNLPLTPPSLPLSLLFSSLPYPSLLSLFLLPLIYSLSLSFSLPEKKRRNELCHMVKSG